MGYILPVQTNQQQYSTRLEERTERYVPVGSVQPVGKVGRLNLDFHAEMNKFIDLVDGEESMQEKADKIHPPMYRGYIQPNPSNLSPAIANVVGKGMSINTYV